MILESFPAGPWQTNCYVLAPAAGSECLIIDPGMHATQGVRDLVERHNLRPVAVLVTHGHIDHMWSVFPVASGYGIPAIVHANDRALLADPTLAMSAQLRASLPDMLGTDDIFAEPDDVVTANDGQHFELASFDLKVRHAPGHTSGSLLYDFGSKVFTGDVLFAGAIGRTDLPGGSPSDMDRSLRDVVLNLDDSCNIFPGHGPSTTMATERQTNPYLVRIAQGLSAQ